MFGIAPTEAMLIGVVALVVLGPEGLRTAARHAGAVARELRGLTRGFAPPLAYERHPSTARPSVAPAVVPNVRLEAEAREEHVSDPVSS